MERLINKVDTLLLKNMNEGLQAAKKEGFDLGKISDGYHTFDELYEHRITLFRKICELEADSGTLYGGSGNNSWKAKCHSDGTSIEGWFIAGIHQEPGKQITYHIPISEWDTWPAIALDKAPERDGHTSADVLQRLKSL